MKEGPRNKRQVEREMNRPNMESIREENLKKNLEPTQKEKKHPRLGTHTTLHCTY